MDDVIMNYVKQGACIIYRSDYNSILVMDKVIIIVKADANKDNIFRTTHYDKNTNMNDMDTLSRELIMKRYGSIINLINSCIKK